MKHRFLSFTYDYKVIDEAIADLQDEYGIKPKDKNIKQLFEETYNCKIQWSSWNKLYTLTFTSRASATAFHLRWK